MKNEHDSASQAQPANDMHERLCAYVLGEGTSEERIEIEREMLRSPELKAQRDQIERTIGLVKTAMAGSESLSPEAAETLVSAASVSRPAPLRSAPWLRIAAGIGAVALGFAIVRSSQNPALQVVTEDAEVAKLDEAAGNAKAMRQIEGLGYGGHERPQPKEAQDTYRGPESVVPPSARDAGVPAEGDKSTQVGLVSEANEMAPAMPSVTGAEVRNFPDSPELEKLKREAVRKAGLRTEAELAPYDQMLQPPIAKDAKENSNDSYFLGQSNAAGAAPAPAPNAGYSTRKLGGGGGKGRSAGRAGESKKQSSVAGATASPSSPGPSGPSTGGPSGSAIPTSSGSQPVLDSRNRDVSSGLDGAPPQEKLAKLAEEAPARHLSDEEEVALEREGSSADDRDELDHARQYYWQLPLAEQQTYLDQRCRRILDGCRPRPNERPRDMFFRFWGDNPFEVAALDRLSTFSADVDTASYALARRYLNEGHVPEKAQIRTEEFVNYFKSDVPAPTSGVFGIHTDLTPSRFSTDSTRQMLRVVVRGKEMSKVEREPLHLTFVVDVSGSMREQNRLEMVKHAIRLLVSQLSPYDKIGIVKFSNDASVVLQLTSVDQRAIIESAIEPLQPEGSTNSNWGCSSATRSRCPGSTRARSAAWCSSRTASRTWARRSRPRSPSRSSRCARRGSTSTRSAWG